MASHISLEILSTNDEHEELFNFIENAVDGTIFHHPTFLSYHDRSKFPEPQYSVTHLLFREDNRIIGFLPGIINHEEKKKRFDSPYGASFGGLITIDLSFEKYDRMVDMTLQYLTEEKEVSEINITPPPRIYSGQNMNDYIEYIYLSKGYRIAKSELAIAARVLQERDFPEKILKDRVKRFVRQAEKLGLQWKISEDVETAYPIIEENQRKFHKKPTHSLAELKTIVDLFPGRILQFLAYAEDIPIAAITLILCNKHVAFSFYISHLEHYSSYRPVDFLFHAVLIWLKEHHYTYVDFGPSTFGYMPHRSLIFFKEGFGGKGIIKHFYRYEVDAKQ